MAETEIMSLCQSAAQVCRAQWERNGKFELLDFDILSLQETSLVDEVDLAYVRTIFKLSLIHI